MFFGSDDMEIEIQSVFFIDRGGQHQPVKGRDYSALSFRVKGDAIFNEETDNPIYLSDGDIFFVPDHIPYSIHSSAEKLICIHFNKRQSLKGVSGGFKPKNKKYFEEKFTRLLEAWTKKRIGYRYECISIMYKIILQIEKEYLSDELPRDMEITNAAEYINEHFTENITVSRLASMCAMSDTYFRRLFEEKFGLTPKKYINKIRLQYALELLKSKYYTVEEVSEKCGFNNINYFSMFIKKETGMPPSKVPTASS